MKTLLILPVLCFILSGCIILHHEIIAPKVVVSGKSAVTTVLPECDPDSGKADVDKCLNSLGIHENY
ncbi:MAG: hypothetical protein ABSB40_12755 [Nitrososphaeria archaeon]|jgi:hypothetical protein